MKILLAIDDSKSSEAAVRAVASLCPSRKSTVRVLHVVEPIETAVDPEFTPPYAMDFGDIARKKMLAGRKLVAHTGDKLRAAGFGVDSAVRQGHPRTAIVDAAAKWHATLIVIGSHGRKGLAKLLLGSVSEHVARHAPCSVLIVRTKRR